MGFPIIDLHCDLLGCIENNESELDFESPKTNCSIPQLIAGKVICQVMAIAALTQSGSSEVSKRQISLYKKLQKKYPDKIRGLDQKSLDSNKLYCLFAIENASALVEEEEFLDCAFQRLEDYAKVAKILYVSLTWNHENRFGGGNASDVGLKDDGRAFLEFISGKNIAIDLSHTSDALADDILNYIDKKSLDVIPIASHSNYRKIKNIPRNLPDEIAKEIIASGGLIGLNFVRRFVGNSQEDFLKHILYGLELGGADVICLGADFYGGLNIPEHLIPERSFPIFQDRFGNSSCYPEFFALLEEKLPEEQLEKIAYKNALNFFKKQNLISRSDF